MSRPRGRLLTCHLSPNILGPKRRCRSAGGALVTSASPPDGRGFRRSRGRARRRRGMPGLDTLTRGKAVSIIRSRHCGPDGAVPRWARSSSTSTSSAESSRELQNASHWKPRDCRNASASSVALAAPLVKSTTQCGETKSILAIERVMSQRTFSAEGRCRCRLSLPPQLFFQLFRVRSIPPSSCGPPWRRPCHPKPHRPPRDSCKKGAHPDLSKSPY